MAFWMLRARQQACVYMHRCGCVCVCLRVCIGCSGRGQQACIYVHRCVCVRACVGGCFGCAGHEQQAYRSLDLQQTQSDTDRHRHTQTCLALSYLFLCVHIFECAYESACMYRDRHSKVSIQAPRGYSHRACALATAALGARAGVTNQLCCQRACGPHAACTGRCC